MASLTFRGVIRGWTFCLDYDYPGLLLASRSLIELPSTLLE